MTNDKPIMSKELIAIFTRTEGDTKVYEVVTPDRRYETIEEYAYAMEAAFGKNAIPGGAERLCANFSAAAAEYRASQPPPDRHRYPSLRDLANGAPVPDWLKKSYEMPTFDMMSPEEEPEE